VAHSPTNRALKATDLFLASIESVPVYPDLIEWVTWEQCLARKAAADVFYDQLHIGYALSSIEAMAMGVPVVSGAYDKRILDLMLAVFGYLPFYLATADNLGSRLKQMMAAGLRDSFALLGRYHVEKWHAEHLVAFQLARIYERAMAR
jgi:glycosyltransferase involved in cell wall biosynthesis